MSEHHAKPAPAPSSVNGSSPAIEEVPATMGVFTGPVTLVSKACTLGVEREGDQTRIVVAAGMPVRHGFVLTKPATRDLIRLLQASLEA